MVETFTPIDMTTYPNNTLSQNLTMFNDFNLHIEKIIEIINRFSNLKMYMHNVYLPLYMIDEIYQIHGNVSMRVHLSGYDKTLHTYRSYIPNRDTYYQAETFILSETFNKRKSFGDLFPNETYIMEGDYIAFIVKINKNIQHCQNLALLYKVIDFDKLKKDDKLNLTKRGYLIAKCSLVYIFYTDKNGTGYTHLNSKYISQEKSDKFSITIDRTLIDFSLMMK